MGMRRSSTIWELAMLPPSGLPCRESLSLMLRPEPEGGWHTEETCMTIPASNVNTYQPSGSIYGLSQNHFHDNSTTPEQETQGANEVRLSTEHRTSQQRIRGVTFLKNQQLVLVTYSSGQQYPPDSQTQVCKLKSQKLRDLRLKVKALRLKSDQIRPSV